MDFAGTPQTYLPLCVVGGGGCKWASSNHAVYRVKPGLGHFSFLFNCSSRKLHWFDFFLKPSSFRQIKPVLTQPRTDRIDKTVSHRVGTISAVGAGLLPHWASPIYHLHWSALMTDGRYGRGGRWGGVWGQIASGTAWLHGHVQTAQALCACVCVSLGMPEYLISHSVW